MTSALPLQATGTLECVPINQTLYTCTEVQSSSQGGTTSSQNGTIISGIASQLANNATSQLVGFASPLLNTVVVALVVTITAAIGTKVGITMAANIWRIREFRKGRSETLDLHW